MELEPRILADCINRLLDSFNRRTTLLITVALTGAAAILSQNLLVITNVQSIGIYSYHIPLLVAYFALCSFLAYLRIDILDKFVLLRQVITEQKALAAFASTIIPYHPWRCNPIFPASPPFASKRIGQVEVFFWLYEVLILAISYAMYKNIFAVVSVCWEFFY
jgi:hypothetical protein